MPQNAEVKLPPKVRSVAYTIYAIVGVVLGAIQIGIGAAEAGQPLWLTIALPVYAFLGGAFGLTARTFTPTGGRDVPDHPAP